MAVLNMALNMATDTITEEEKTEQTHDEENDAEGAFSDEKKIYELGFHFLPTLSKDDVQTELDKLKSEIEKLGCVYISDEFPKNVPLAYTISKKENSKNTKYDNTYFGWIKFEGNPEQAIALKDLVDANANVLRFIILKTVREHMFVRPKAVTYTKPAKRLQEVPKKEEKEQKVSEKEIDTAIEELVKE